MTVPILFGPSASILVTDRDATTAYYAAVIGAAVMIAFQTAGKATRDALFLSSFDVSMLPRTVMAAAVVSVFTALVASRWMTVRGPARVVPVAFFGSAVLLGFEWVLVSRMREVVAIAVYLHFAALGAVLISGFWSVVNERFDPRTAKRYVGRIAAGGTVGGLAGGILAERIGHLGAIQPMFLVLAGLHLVSGALLLVVRRGGVATAQSSEDDTSPLAGIRVITGIPYLRTLVALVLLVTVSEALIDYVFKATASARYGSGAALLRFFAVFYTGTSLLTVILQTVGSRAALQRMGLTRTVAMLPAGVGVGALAALGIPGLPSIVGVRALEQMVRHGLYRAGYELLFTPVAPGHKRSAKALVDVGVVRLGDIAGSGLVQIALLTTAAAAVNLMLGIAVVVSILGVVVAVRLRRGYVVALERSLLSRAIQLDLDEVEDAVTRSTVIQSMGGIALTRAAREPRGLAPPAEGATRSTLPPDPELEQIARFRSRKADVARTALQQPISAAVAAHVIPLLAWDDVLPDAIAALRRLAPRIEGQLIDHLLDPDAEFAVRRRVPIVLADLPTERTFDGLLRGLQDSRFEVRYRCGRVLNRLHERNPDLAVRDQRVYDLVLQEVAVDHGVWESHRLLDRMEDEDWSPVMDELLRERANRGLEHVFTLLALVLPRQPLKVAFRGLHTSDQLLRGTALEYLETALPEDIRKALWPFLEVPARRRASRRSAQDVLSELMESNQSIAMNLAELRRLQSGPSSEQPDEES
jgi:hypothetical protein